MQDTARRKGRPLLTIVLIAVLALTVLAVVVVLMFGGVIPVPDFVVTRLAGAKPPEYSARYYPRDTLAYYWLTLTPSDGQLSDSREIFQLLNEYPVFEDWLDEIQDDFEEETGIDFDADVQSWIGVDFSAALIDFDVDNEEIEAAATVAVRDSEAAAEFLDDWLDYLEDESGSDFDKDSSGEFEIWIDENNPQAYAFSDNLLVIATSEDILDDVIDRVEGDGGNSLANVDNFATARSALPERRFTSLYLNVDSIVDELDEELSNFDVWGIYSFVGIEEELPEWMAVSAGWVDRGVVVESVTPADAPGAYGASGKGEPSEMLPGNTLAYIAAAFDPDIDAWRAELRNQEITDVIPEFSISVDDFNYELAVLADEMGLPEPPKLRPNSELDDALDLGLWWGNEMIGIDFESDFFDYLDGKVILAVSNFDLEELSEAPESNLLDTTAMLSYHSENAESLSETMEDIADFIRDEFDLDSDTVNVGAGVYATVFEFPEYGYEPGYVLLRDYLTFGTTANALEDLASSDNRLASDREYQRGMDHISSEWEFLAYLDLRLVTSQINAFDVDLSRSQRNLIEEVFGVVVLSLYQDSDYSRFKSVLTLFPE